jgi:SAM-dependent methyltransferase
MLTVDFERFPVRPGDRVLDLGCGAGRHAFELYRRGADVVAFDQDRAELLGVAEIFAGMKQAVQVPADARARVVEGDALVLPFHDGEFDRIIAAEVLEHIPDDGRAIAELVRVLRPGGTLAVTVPRWLPERVCWALSDRYHEVDGGHVRIYKASELARRLEQAGLAVDGITYAHALHAPYWWLKCAVGVENDTNPLVTAYHRLLVWDITKAPGLTRTAERLLNPLVGKSVVLYATKPESAVSHG